MWRIENKKIKRNFRVGDNVKIVQRLSLPHTPGEGDGSITCTICGVIESIIEEGWEDTTPRKRYEVVHHNLGGAIIKYMVNDDEDMELIED